MANEKGFTLIESLLSLLIFMIIATFFIMFLRVLFPQIDEQRIPPFEWENFVRQVQLELRESAEWRADGDTFYFTMIDGRKATYGRYQQLLRKQVDGLGHEVLLQNVASFACVSIPNGVQFQIIDTTGKTYERIITHMEREEVAE